MNKTQLKKEIQKQSKEAGVSELNFISTMQSVCAKKGDDKTLSMLIEIKRDYL